VSVTTGVTVLINGSVTNGRSAWNAVCVTTIDARPPTISA
jgi:hypothetical protein